MFIKSNKKTGGTNDIQKKTFHLKNKWLQILLSIIVGFAIGIISGVFGAGGGIMVLLALIFIMSYPLHKAIGTSTLIMTMTALSSTIGYAVRGNIDFQLGSMLAVGAVAGGILGSRYANKVNEQTLQKVVSICFFFMGIAMTAIELVKLK